MLRKNILKITTFAILFLVFTINIPPSLSLNRDGLALLALKAAINTDPTQALASWSDSDPTPCNWQGITCISYRVTSIYLRNKILTGYLPSELGLLDSLTQLILSHNNFSMPIPSHLFDASNLRFLDLSHNSLSGPIPTQINSLQALIHLDISSNCLNGSLPPSLIQLKSLTGTLNLSYNAFSGEIPESYGQFPVMVSLDLKHNNLRGKVPLVGSLVNQGPTAFAGNPSLCGFPLQTPCPEAVNITSTENPEHPNDLPGLNFVTGTEDRVEKRNGSVAVPLISGISVVIGVVSVSVWLFRRKWGSEKGKMGKEERMVNDNNNNDALSEGGQKKFVLIDEGFNLELEDLLRASAYVVGKGRAGIVYKVVVGSGNGSGTVVAVRRLSEGDTTWRFREFESEVEAIGRVYHPNIVRLRAYYYANDEKLLISDFIRNGSLHMALHGGPSNTLPPLSWAARLKIAQGTARGLRYIHEFSGRKYVHGNLKSSKILLDVELQAYISSFGLTHLLSATSKFTTSASKKQYLNQTVVTSTMGFSISAPSNIYLAPEARVAGCKLTQKCDVYSFGIILMELLTGRVPNAGPENEGKGLESLVRKMFREERPMSEIVDPALLSEAHVKKQVIAMFHIALNCTELNAEVRPRMRTVSESLDRMKLL